MRTSARSHKRTCAGDLAPPNGKQIRGSHPIYLTLPYLRDDGKVLGRRFHLAMRKAKLRPTTLDEIGHTGGAALQTIENIAAHQGQTRKSSNDNQSLLRAYSFCWRTTV